MNKNSIAFGAPGIEPRWTSSAKDGIGTADEVARLVRFLLSKESSYIIGTESIIDGGLRLA